MKSAPLVALLCVGCGSGVQLTTDLARYQRSDATEVTLTLQNHGGDTVRHFLCGAELERQVGSGWAPASLAPINCILVGGRLRPLESAVFTHVLGADVTLGTYRFATEVSGSSPQRVVSESFQVEH